ncbi:choline kinase [Ophiocordyceps camponoti-floridani]|uniref:Choline kinase n=1 Tax=Ophiocordyceps camponoti-floridani TaxID=2030778 RepID=A0A8H4VD81_9HYPO|nr:choline kinase [Ophiocordyceps camponoti-floridani]
MDDDGHGRAVEEQRQNRYQYYGEKMLAQVGDWLHRERSKAARRAPSSRRRAEADSTRPQRKRADSLDSQSSSLSLDKLQAILDDSLAHLGLSTVPRNTPKVSRLRRRGSSRLAASSDTDYVDGDAVVPACDAWLDNSRDRLTFNKDIIRITHTLRLKGWRRVPLDDGDAISVERLSGALTNAVYVVTPSPDLGRAPSRILLRIYGPQVEHLIDRDNELKVLQRLARNKIGPRLLGTFKNGRFEHFFNAITLRPLDLREPETSRQIAKRMRELHAGIDVLPHEREAGPAVWRNWDQWLDNVSKIVTHLDAQYEIRGSATPTTQAVGLVLGVPWDQFRDAVSRYRVHLIGFYQGARAVKERLVFAHNDTQYGNILRLRPDDEKSPLLQAANKHKQLVVIDFEYAAANVAGLEFANHFTEWSYDYHDALAPYACTVDRYPSIDEQRRFIKAYVDHRPQLPSSTTDSNPSSPRDLLATQPSSSSVVDFVLDARAPPGGWGAVERDRDHRSDQRVRELLDETLLWRPANSAQWVAWGIVQAAVPGLGADNEPLTEDELRAPEKGAAVDEFDYLAYAQDRALFFWGDVVRMGLVGLDELPEGVRARIKMIER